MTTLTSPEWHRIADQLNKLSAQLDSVKFHVMLTGDVLLFASINIASLQASLAADLAKKNA